MLHSVQTTNIPVYAKIGPNALIQTVNALRELYSEAQIAAMLALSGHVHLLEVSPEGMVDENEFDRLVDALAANLGVLEARRVLQRAGELTAFYLLEHRIPRPFQKLLRWLPRRMALRLLLVAMQQNAWTFIGSGTFTFDLSGKLPTIQIASNIRLMEAACGFFGGTFECLIQTLVDGGAFLRYVIDRETCDYVIQFS